MLRFYNTLSGQLEDFWPILEHEVGMYACGPTVYDYAHIGNFRTFMFEDLLRRFLEFDGYKVRHVMNLTDVDDKTIAGAKKAGQTLAAYTEIYIRAFQEDLKTLNIIPPNFPAEQPRATREIDSMKALIKILLEKGIAYEKDGSVYYRVSGFPEYGKLSKKDLKKNIAGARVEVDEYDKEEGADFALWKSVKDGEPDFWYAPWGNGRPGWHIECSAMSMKYLGPTFDIHAGGEDLIFPHHENEIAQSEAATEMPFVRYWLHSKHLLVDGEKMSKSKGNFYTLRDLVAKGYDPMAIRYLLISVHYRSPLNFTLDALKEAGETVKKLDDCYFQCLTLFPEKQSAGTDLGPVLEKAMERIRVYLEDDLNVAGALSVVFEAVKEINTALAGSWTERSRIASLIFFDHLEKLFGFDMAATKQIPDEVLGLLSQRSEVRKNPAFKTDKTLQAQSDQMRDKIQALGWLIKDSRPGSPSTLKKKRRIWD